MNIKTIITALSDGINQGIMIVTTMACCGIMIGTINLTGASAKLGSFLLSASGDSKLTSLILVMCLAMFLGLAMNITPAYLLTAVAAAPLLIDFGIPPIAAHMFILFYAAMATITPPVALTAFAAASIADAPPMGVGFLAMRIGFLAYILPFAFVINPALLMLGSFWEIGYALISGIFAVATIAYGLEGWFFGSHLKPIPRVAVVLAGVFFLLANIYLFALALLIIIIVAAIALKSKNDYIKTDYQNESLEEGINENEM